MGSTRLCITIFVVLWFGWKPRVSKSFYSVFNNGTATDLSDTDATNRPWSPAWLARSRLSVDGDDRRVATSGVWKRKRRAPALSFPLPFLSSVREGNSTNAYIHAFSFLLSKHRKPQSYSAKLLLHIKPTSNVAYTLLRFVRQPLSKQLYIRRSQKKTQLKLNGVYCDFFQPFTIILFLTELSETNL